MAGRCTGHMCHRLAGCLTDVNQEVLGAVESFLGVGAILGLVEGWAVSLVPHPWDVSSNPLSFDNRKHLQKLPNVLRLEGAPEHQAWAAGARLCRGWEERGRVGHCRLKLRGRTDCAQRGQWPWWGTGAQELQGLTLSCWDPVCGSRGLEKSILGPATPFPSRALRWPCYRAPVAFTAGRTWFRPAEMGHPWGPSTRQASGSGDSKCNSCTVHTFFPTQESMWTQDWRGTYSVHERTSCAHKWSTCPGTAGIFTPRSLPRLAACVLQNLRDAQGVLKVTWRKMIRTDRLRCLPPRHSLAAGIRKCSFHF